MKRLFLAAICAVAIVSSAVAGGELPQYPVAPPPAYMPYPVYTQAFVAPAPVTPTVGERVKGYLGGVWFDTVDAVREPVDMALNVVSLGYIDLSNDDQGPVE